MEEKIIIFRRERLKEKIAELGKDGAEILLRTSKIDPQTDLKVPGVFLSGSAEELIQKVDELHINFDDVQSLWPQKTVPLIKTASPVPPWCTPKCSRENPECDASNCQYKPALISKRDAAG